MDDSNCPLCQQPARPGTKTNLQHNRDTNQTEWNCKTCGRFRIGDAANRLLECDSSLQSKRFLLSAYTRENSDVLIDADFLDQPGQGFPRERTVPEKMVLVLRHFARNSIQFGHSVITSFENDYPIGWCRSPQEWKDLVGMLVKDMKFLDGSGSLYSVTFKGWEWIETKPREANPTVFVAMNFDERYQVLQKKIERAIREAGYDPKVVNKELYAGGVMDQVLALIREARFVVADYTGNRGGVYYEAGFALGLGKTVIHSCRKEMLDISNGNDRLHFDVAHLKVIPWKDDDLATFSAELEAHILAVFGRGPVNPLDIHFRG